MHVVNTVSLDFMILKCSWEHEMAGEGMLSMRGSVQVKGTCSDLLHNLMKTELSQQMLDADDDPFDSLLITGSIELRFYKKKMNSQSALLINLTIFAPKKISFKMISVRMLIPNVQNSGSQLFFFASFSSFTIVRKIIPQIVRLKDCIPNNIQYTSIHNIYSCRKQNDLKNHFFQYHFSV